MRLTGVKQKMSSAYHPETDGASERTNKTVIQALRFHVQRNQKGWVKALPLVRFNYMNVEFQLGGSILGQSLSGTD